MYQAYPNYYYNIIVSTGMPLHSVGLDEAHEMCINKESKTSITRPTKDNMERLARVFPYRRVRPLKTSKIN